MDVAPDVLQPLWCAHPWPQSLIPLCFYVSAASRAAEPLPVALEHTAFLSFRVAGAADDRTEPLET